MVGNLFTARVITLTTSYVAVSAATDIVTGTLEVAAGNSGTTYIRGDDGSANVILPKGVPFPFSGVDLSTVYLKGGAGDIVTIIGGGSGR
jgi:hypothetical protein